MWRAAALASLPFVALLAFHCLRPRDYYTGTNSVEAYTYVVETPAGHRVCVPGLEIPAGTARIRLQLISRTRIRPTLRMVLHLAETPGARVRTVTSTLVPATVPSNRISGAIFTIPPVPSQPSERPASLCLTAADVVNWGGTPLPVPPSPAPPTLNGRPIAGRIAVWYLPAAGSQRSYISRFGAILRRASLFRPSPVGPWLYALILLIVLPGLALASVRCLALAAASRGTEASPSDSHPVQGPSRQPECSQSPRVERHQRVASWSAPRAALWLLAIAAINFWCWALITPPFQAPDEVDHFAYTQSLVERGEAPSRNPTSPLPRWSSAQALALENMSFFSDHQVGDSRLPWTASQQQRYRAQVAALHPRGSDGGGNETAATHGAIYYSALTPAYLLASSSPLSQLTLMRLASALIGALTVVFTFLLARELAPGRPWLAVLAALLVAYQPMYGFISGAVNNDVGANAGAAALELLAIVMLRRGVTLRLGLLTGGLLIALPIVKGTTYSLYPVVGIALAAIIYRHHRRSEIRGWAGLACGALAIGGLSVGLAHVFHPSATLAAGGKAPAEAGSVTGSVSEALAHPFGYISYVWQVFLPRLPFMAPHFQGVGWPAFVIFVERGWGAFGWYDVFFSHWMYVAILIAMLLVPLLAIIAARREWTFVRTHKLELVILLLMPIAVIAGFEAAFYSAGVRLFLPEFGRYAFPAIAPVAVLVVGSLHAFGRRLMIFAGVTLLVAMLALSFASQLLTLTGFYA